MNAPALGAALLASFDDQTIAALAERLRPHLAQPTVEHALLTAAEAGERLRLHPKTVVRMARDGRLPATKIGTSWRFHTDQLDITSTPRPMAASRPCPPSRRRAQSVPASVAAIRGTQAGRAA
jgi:excisionase family DNA binding protein